MKFVYYYHDISSNNILVFNGGLFYSDRTIKVVVLTSVQVAYVVKMLPRDIK